MRQIFLSLMMGVLITVPSHAAGVKDKVKRGNALYEEEKFEEARNAYEGALENAPDSDIVNFNLGAALYRLKGYEQAMRHFEKSLLTEDERLKQKASYNTGNAKYKYGINIEEENLKEAVHLLEQSLRHYERALEIDPEDEDAAFNYEFVKKELSRLKEKLAQQKQTQQQESEEGKREEKESQGEQQAEDKRQKEQEEQEKQQQAHTQEEPQEEKAAREEEKTETDGQKQAARSSERALGEISEEEARMLLENYAQEEEPKGLYRPPIKRRQLPGVKKDW